MQHHLPLFTGPYAPGITDVMLDYSDKSPFIRLYYPSEEELDANKQSDKWIPWMPDDSYLEGMAKVLMLYKIFLKIAFWWSKNVKIPAMYGTRPKSTLGPLKCILMSHGLGGCRFLYTNICCELASRGFLVAALEHRDRSACHTFYYKTKADALKDIRSSIEFLHVNFGKNHYTKRNEQLKDRATECKEVMKFLKDLNEGIVPNNVMDETPLHKTSPINFKLNQLVGMLDLDNIVMMGHSFGAATALYTLSQHLEFKLGVLLDPWMFPVKNEQLESTITQPLLFVNTQTFHIEANIQSMSKLMDAKKEHQMFTIKHTTHENQTDTVLLVGYWLNWFMKKINPLKALKINNSLILKFFKDHLKYPENISDCLEILNKEVDNIELGLTKPWA